MKRRLTKLVLFLLLLGAVINVAVAWGCELLLSTGKLNPERSYTFFPSESPRWSVYTLQCTVAQRTIATDLHQWTGTERETQVAIAGALLDLDEYARSFFEGFTRSADFEQPRWSSLHRTHLSSRPTTSGIIIEAAAGWPLPALRYWASIETTNFNTGTLDLRAGIPLTAARRVSIARTAPTVVALPLAPIWPGFAINTVFYAALLWMLALGPFTARRVIRHKRDHCIECGYDLNHAPHDNCPECGWEHPT